MRNVLLICGRYESYYFEPFVAACEPKGIQVFVLDSSLFPQRAVLSIATDQRGQHRGEVKVLAWSSTGVREQMVSIEDMSAAWSLRDNADLQANESSVEARFRESETDAALKMLYSLLQCPWVNRRQDVTFLSRNKLYQQVVAAQCGLLVPRTLVSNDPVAVAAFSEPHKGLLLKSMGYIKLDSAGRYFLYSERFSHEELTLEKDAIRSCPDIRARIH